MSFNWDDARLCDSLAYDLKLGDFPRARNRALINNLYNGFPPYSHEEVSENKIDVNVNFLEGTRLLHDARAQFTQAFLKPGKYFTLRTDYGPRNKRQQHSFNTTRHMNRIMKRSLKHYEMMRSKFGLLVLHGIAPAVWENEDRWCSRAIGVEDALVPSNTLVGFDNLPFYMVYRSFTGYELKKLTRQIKGKNPPGWNMRLVKKAIEWVDAAGTSLMGTNWPEVWSPEKLQERVKGDGGFYATDQLPTIDCFDIYAYDDRGKESGWIRRIILDAWSTPGNGAMTRNGKLGALSNIKTDDFLYTSHTRRIADSMQNLISFQFADLSAVAPFRYHSVRSLGFLLYAVCHLQNRLRGKFNEAVFEALMQYFRVKTMDDVQRALQLQLANKGFIEDGVSIVPAAERWQVNSQLVELGMSENSNLIREQAAGAVQNTNFSRDRVEKTRFQVMAEVNAATSMLSAGLLQAYQYQTFEYRENVRRFMKKDSTDPEVREFRAACLKDGVPQEMLQDGIWDVDPERVIGAGNKTLEMAATEQLMQWRPLFDPDAQRYILNLSTMNVTDDPALADRLVPEGQKISTSIQAAEWASGSLMQGLHVSVPGSGVNLAEYAEHVLVEMAVIVKQAQSAGNMATPQQLQGLNAMASHVAECLKIVSQDKEAREIVASLSDQLNQLMNLIKGFAQRLAQAMQAKAKQNGAGDGKMDPKDQAKIQATMATADTKMKIARESHAQRTAQRQIQFEHQIQQDDARAQQELKHDAISAGIEIAKQRMKSVGGEDDA